MLWVGLSTYALGILQPFLRGGVAFEREVGIVPADLALRSPVFWAPPLALVRTGVAEPARLGATAVGGGAGFLGLREAMQEHVRISSSRAHVIRKGKRRT